MVPMLFVGLLFTLFIHESPKGFFMNSAKYGYWYLQVLTTFYITMSLFNINKNRLLAVDLLLSVVIWGLFWIGSKTARQDNDVLCLINCKLLWPYFVFGFLCNQHRRLIDTLCHTRTYSIAFVLNIATLYLYIAEGFSPIRYAVPTVAIITCLYLFRMREQKDSAAERQLSFFGRHSLSIYIFHYFFIYNIHFEGLGSWFEWTGNWMVEFFLCCIMAFLISYLSIFLGLTMEKGPFLRTIFLGKFPQSK